ncbi:MAG: Pycsar system effector family protein [Bacteroidia bacterium]
MQTVPIENLLDLVKEHVTIHIKNNVSTEFVFHDLLHTQQVVEAVIEMSEEFHFNTEETIMMQLAAWFHDTGYDKGQEGHEERSAEYAEEFLGKRGYSSENIEIIKSAILATKMPQTTKSLYDKVLCDADMSHLGKKIYWERSSKIRQELLLTKGIAMTEEEWIEFELGFMLKQHYHTPIAELLYDKRKAKNIKQLRKQQSRLNPYAALTVDEISEKEVKQVKQQSEIFGDSPLKESEAIKEKRLVRGVETMYKTTYQTHNNLSAMADHKANMMLSINTICISIIASTLIPKVIDGSNTKLVVPTALLMVVCLISMVYATLATRPKITEGSVSREDIVNKKANLLFFGNFYNMKLNDFQWGVKEMIKDPDYLYSTMSRDIYFLGVVLAKKYRYLSICYNVFMFGLILTVLAFAIAFLF